MKLRVITAVALLASCDMSRFGEETGPISQALNTELRDKKTNTINLRSLTPFEWDEFVLFAPYEGPKEICPQLALSEKECREKIRVASNADEEMVMIFRKNGKIVHVERHHRFHGDFMPQKEAQKISAESALFAVSQFGKSGNGEAWLVLTQQGTNAPPNIPVKAQPSAAGTSRKRAAPYL